MDEASAPRRSPGRAGEWLRAAPWLLVLAGLLHVGSARLSMGAGPALWPYTDAVEYASMTTWMLRGEGPVLRIGPAFLPARVPPTTAILLLPQALANGGDARGYHRTIFVAGVLALLALWRLGLALGLSSPAALTAAGALALAPGFACYAGLVMSDVPALLVLLLLFLCARRIDVGHGRGLAGRVAFGVLAGVLVAFRVTNAIWPAALLASWSPVTRRALLRPRSLAAAALAFGAPLLPLALLNWVSLGSPLASSYAYWLPWLRSQAGLDLANLFGSVEGGSGNVPYYLSELAGLRSEILGISLGWKSDLHSLPALLLGTAGLVWLARRPCPARRSLLLPLALGLAPLLAVSSLLSFQDWRYLLPVAALSAFGCGALVDALAPQRAPAWRRLAVPPLLLLPLAVAVAQPAPVPSRKLVTWRDAVASHAQRAPVPGTRPRPTPLPLAVAALFAPKEVVFIPSDEPFPVRDVHLSLVRRFALPPLRVDPGRESLWLWIADPLSARPLGQAPAAAPPGAVASLEEDRARPGGAAVALQGAHVDPLPRREGLQ
jgi:4-amino-4-deoxy-L-arabinose transferase-like glycosyltransferase